MKINVVSLLLLLLLLLLLVLYKDCNIWFQAKFARVKCYNGNSLPSIGQSHTHPSPDIVYPQLILFPILALVCWNAPFLEVSIDSFIIFCCDANGGCQVIE